MGRRGSTDVLAHLDKGSLDGCAAGGGLMLEANYTIPLKRPRNNSMMTTPNAEALLKCAQQCADAGWDQDDGTMELALRERCRAFLTLDLHTDLCQDEDADGRVELSVITGDARLEYPKTTR